MHHRELLATANVSDETLTELVAALLKEPPGRVTVVSSDVEQVAYDLPTITTAGRYWVRGQALVGGEPKSFCFFVKHVQSWARSPMFAEVPAELAVMAEAGVPWRVEPLAYRSDLGQRLPHGLRMPRAVGGVRPGREVSQRLAGSDHDGIGRVGRGPVLEGGLSAGPARS